MWINAGSRQIYPSALDGKSREIYAEGEICIEVAHDAARPFSVHTGRMDIRVPEARFYVTSWARSRPGGDARIGFDNTPLSDVLARLARYYNRTFDCTPEVSIRTISGKLELNDAPAEVLRTLSLTAPICFRTSEQGFRLSSAQTVRKGHDDNPNRMPMENTPRTEKSRTVSPNTARREMKSKITPF